MNYSSGDLFDKCTILQIKKGKNLTVPEFDVVWKEVENLIGTNKELKELYQQLVFSNLKQYELEDKVRVETSMEKVGEIAIAIRVQNDHRVMLKNKINKLTNNFEEVKLYKRHI